MNCQHDPLLPNTTMQIQSNGQASRIICLECLRASFITKRGMFIDADPPEHAIPVPETRVGCEGDDGLLRIHSKRETCEICEKYGPCPDHGPALVSND